MKRFYALLAVVFLAGSVAARQDPTDEQVKKWIEQLAADYQDERDEAKANLAKVGIKAEGALITALDHSDHRVRRASLELLVAAKSTKAVEKVSELFKKDADRSVRETAFSYLLAANKAAEDPLIEALGNDEPKFRLGAVQKLKEIKSEKCAKDVAALYDKEQDPAIKAASFECLKNIGKPAQPFLLLLLGSTDAAVRNGAIDGLRNIGSIDPKTPPEEEVVNKVAGVFVIETEPTVLNNAYEFLKSQGVKSEPHFIAGLHSAQQPVRLKALEGLETLKSDKGIEAAASLFETDPQDDVRDRARKYLEGFGSKVEDHFIKALENANPRVKLGAIQALGKIQSEKPLATIAKMFREDSDKQVHEDSFKYLSNLGLKAEKELILALDDANIEIRKGAIAALGNARSEAAIPRLIDFLNEINPELKPLAIDALVRIGTKAIEAVNKAVEEGRIKKGAASGILGLYYQEEVERLLANLISDTGEYGYFEGMFAELKNFGAPKAVPVLIRIMKDDSYRPRIDAKGDANRFPLSIRGLAILALGEMGDKSAIEPLDEALKGLMPGYDETKVNILIALFKLGETKHLEKYTKGLENEAEQGLENGAKDGFGTLFSLALLKNRLGKHDEAEKIYLRVVKGVEESKSQKEVQCYNWTLYNLACLYALKSDKAKAVGFLRRAVEAGFLDKCWVQKDKDLDSIRGEEGYKKLLADEKAWQPKDEP